ncbi:MAG: peptidase [Herbinix sp.]|jgi:bla regulator protein BlaR1|nr:peptidase [Herbinix sp.]
MNLLVKLFQQNLSIGATAGFLIVIILLVKKVFGKTISPRWQYIIWSLLIVRLLLPIIPESSFSIYNVFYTVARELHLPVSVFENSVARTHPQKEPANSAGTITKEPPVTTVTNSTSPNQTGSSHGAVNTSVGRKAFDVSPITIATFLWIVGIVLFSAYILWINIVFVWKVHTRYTPLEDKRINDILNSCIKLMKMKHRVPVYATKKRRAPSLYVSLRAKILVSEAYMKQLSDEEIKYIFLHELTHYKRRDIVINWILTLLQIVNFYNPLIWYAFTKIREDNEISCDAVALQYLEEKDYKNYGNTIIKLISLLSESNFIPATAGISKNKTSYKRRIIMISKFKQNKRWTSNLIAVLLIVTLGLVGLTGCKLKNNEETGSNTVNTENQTDGSDSNTENSDAKDNESTDTQTSDENSSQETTEDGNNEQENADIDNSSDDAEQSNPDQSNEAVEDQNQDQPVLTSDDTSTENENTLERYSFYGDWKINKVLAYGSAGTFSSEDAESLVGKTVSLSEDSATGFGDQASYLEDVIDKPTYAEAVITAEDFVINYRMSFELLGISAESVTEITVSDANNVGYSFLIKDENTLVLIGGGTYFELIR